MADAEGELYERVLILRCRAGDQSAYAELIGRYQPRLRYFVRQMLRDPGCDEDVLQNIWLNVFRSLPGLVDVSTFRAWLYRIAHNWACQEHRRRGVACQPLADHELIDDVTADEHLSAENAERVHAALSTLDDEHREVLVLHFLEELSYEDVAVVVGCPVGTIRSRIHYGKRALKRALERMICNAR